MGIEYLGLSSINGPLVILEGVQDAFFDEIVEFMVDGSLNYTKIKQSFRYLREPKICPLTIQERN